MTYVLLALAALVYLWPDAKPPRSQHTTGSQAAFEALMAVQSRLIRTQAFSEPCQEAVRTLAAAIAAGADL